MPQQSRSRSNGFFAFTGDWQRNEWRKFVHTTPDFERKMFDKPPLICRSFSSPKAIRAVTIRNSGPVQCSNEWR